MLSSRYYSASRVGTDIKPRTALVVDDDEDMYQGFNEVSPALDARALREDDAFQEALKTASVGRKIPSRMGTGVFRGGTVTASRAGTASARPMTAVRAAGYTSAARPAPTPDRREDSVEEKVKQMEARIMSLVEESCMLSAKPDADDEATSSDGDAVKREYDPGKALTKAQEASALERQLIRMQEQANLGDSHNLDLTFCVLCNLAGQYALNEMYTEALNTYQLLTRNKLFPHANRLKVNMGNIYFKMGEHPKALKLYRMALDQTPTAEKDLRMKVMHNIGLLLVRMGKFRDAVTNFQHVMHEQGDFQTGLHLVLCSVALNDAEGGKAAFHAMLDVEPPTYHQDIAVEDESDAYEAVLRDVLRGDKLSAWSRAGAAAAERCLALAAAALSHPPPPAAPAAHAALASDDAGMSWCVEALRGYDSGGGGGGGAGSAGARLELSAALASLRSAGIKTANGQKALQRIKVVARAHPNDRIIKAEANADAAFVAYALGNYAEARQLAESAAASDPYSCPARVTAALAAAKTDSFGLAGATEALAAACRLDVTDAVAQHDLALSLEARGDDESLEAAGARWVRLSGCGGAWRALAAAARARAAAASRDLLLADHCYSSVSWWDGSVSRALAELHARRGDSAAAKHHYQDVESVWSGDTSALEWLGAEARGRAPDAALHYYRRAARLQPNNPAWGLQLGACLRAAGRYQEALALYKKLHQRFPDNVQCLKLIVKLCGDQGLAETGEWSRELQRAHARQQQTTSVASAGSVSSGASHSPVDNVRGGGSRADSGGGGAGGARGSLSRLSTGSSGRRTLSGRLDSRTYGGDNMTQDSVKTTNRSLNRNEAKQKRIDEFDDELPLPPE